LLAPFNANVSGHKMTHLPEIWDCIREHLPRRTWVPLDDIYALVERRLSLDREDHKPQAPGSLIPKWKRNVRNVLQYRKRKGEVEWNKHAHYRM
jgi:hypothetical protein